jgi:hypothetical protein
MDCFLYRPSKLQSGLDQFLAQSMRSFVYISRNLALWGVNHQDGALVASLFQPSGPSAVLRTVWAVVVDAVNRMLIGWPWSHVSEECREVVPPMVADGDSSSTIVRIAFQVWLVATALNRAPCDVFNGMAHSMFQQLRSRLVSFQASAAMRIVASQITTTDTGCIPAITATFPIDFVWLRAWQFPNDKQPSESSAGIFDALHG